MVLVIARLLDICFVIFNFEEVIAVHILQIFAVGGVVAVIAHGVCDKK